MNITCSLPPCLEARLQFFVFSWIRMTLHASIWVFITVGPAESISMMCTHYIKTNSIEITVAAVSVNSSICTFAPNLIKTLILVLSKLSARPSEIRPSWVLALTGRMYDSLLTCWHGPPLLRHYCLPALAEPSAYMQIYMHMTTYPHAWL